MASDSEPIFKTPESEALSPERDGYEDNKEILMKKLAEMPIDKLKSIITNQIDLEIRLKHKELALTEEEIGKCESQMITLRKFFKIPSNVNFDNEPNGFTHKYSALLNKALSVNYENVSKLSVSGYSLGPSSSHGSISYNTEDMNLPTHSYRTRSTTSSLRPSSSQSSRKGTMGCLYRRTDGIIVKLTCPNCLRSNFSSAQGFLNHSRIAHSKEYTSQDAAALTCGEILPEEEQDEEGLTSLQNLKLKNLDANKHLNVNEIYFNGLSTSLSGGHNDGVEKCTFDVGTLGVSPDEKFDSIEPIEIEQDVKSEQMDGQKDQLPKPENGRHNHLMKKLMEKGITNTKDEYDTLINETMSEVKNSHLFAGEEEEITDEVINEEKKSTVEETYEYDNQRQRRKSRSGVGISKPGKFSKKNNKNSTVLPKLKLKLKRV